MNEMEIALSSILVMKKLKSPMTAMEGVRAEMGDEKLSEIIRHFEEVEGGTVSIPKLSEIGRPSSVKNSGNHTYVEQLIFFNKKKGDTEVRYRIDRKEKSISIEDVLIS